MKNFKIRNLKEDRLNSGQRWKSHMIIYFSHAVWLYNYNSKSRSRSFFIIDKLYYRYTYNTKLDYLFSWLFKGVAPDKNKWHCHIYKNILYLIDSLFLKFDQVWFLNIKLIYIILIMHYAPIQYVQFCLISLSPLPFLLGCCRLRLCRSDDPKVHFNNLEHLKNVGFEIPEIKICLKLKG